MEQSERRYVVYVKGDFESVHYNSRGKILQIDGYYSDNQDYYKDTIFSNSLLSAKTWKRKKDAENKLTALTSNCINKRKNLIGEVIEVTLTISY